MLHRLGKRVHAPLLRSTRALSSQATAVAATPAPTPHKPTASVDRRAAGRAELAAPSPSNSFVDSLFPSKMPRVPLDQPFPTPYAVKPQPDTVSEDLKVTTLSSGLRVATKNSTSPIAHVGVFVEVGSRYESVQYNGITRFIEQMAFKSTKNRSAFRLVRDMGKLAANLSASAGREHLIFTGDILRHNVPYILGTLQDVMFHHAYSIEEIQVSRRHALEEADSRDKNPEQTMLEAVHEAAYMSNTLGLSLYPKRGSLERLTPEVLAQWTRNAFVPSRVVISAVGVEHEEFVANVEKIFKFPAEYTGKGIPKTPAKYSGGDLRMHRTIGEGEKNLAHLAIAFETASWNDPDLVPMCVLQMIMGGGSGFSTGGPGKGMYSRCYTNILNRFDWVDTASCFNSIFTDTGLFGFYGSAAPESLGQLANVLIAECNGMTGNVDPQELSRAKNQLKSSVYMQLESASLQLEDIGRQIATYGKFTAPADLARQIDSVTATDIQRVARRMLKTAPSIAAYGDLTFLPRYESFPSAIRS